MCRTPRHSLRCKTFAERLRLREATAVGQHSGFDAQENLASCAITLQFYEEQPERTVSQAARRISQPLAGVVVVVVVVGDLEGAVLAAGMEEEMVLMDVAVAAG